MARQEADRSCRRDPGSLRRQDRGGTVDAAGGLEKQQGVPHQADVVDADDLHSLPGQRERGSHRTRAAVGLPVSEHLANEPFAQCPTSSGQPAA